MKITVLNSGLSAISEATEARVLWTPLLVADPLFYAEKNIPAFEMSKTLSILPENE